MGTGQGRGVLDTIAGELIGAAIAYLEMNPNCGIERVYFLTWSQHELDACRQVLAEFPDIVALP
jgi:hypothetical protein